MSLVVTGGSRGIGAAICRLAAERGHDVVIGYSSGDAAAVEVAGQVRQYGRRALTVRGDVSSEDDVRALFDAAAELGPVTGVVNNAAITGNTPGRLDEQDVRTVRRVLDVNVTGVFLCCREAVRRMSTRHGGSGGAIVNVSSTAARTGAAGEWVHYAATKAAVETLTFGLAQEVVREGIRVNAVAPGLVETIARSGRNAGPDRPDRADHSRRARRPSRGNRRSGAVAALAGRLLHRRRGADGRRRPLSCPQLAGELSTDFPEAVHRGIWSVAWVGGYTKGRLVECRR